MNGVPDSTEQGSAELRKEIDCTRSAMAAKLEELEDRVMDSVQSAQESVEDTIQIAKETVADSIQTAKETVASVKRTLNLKHQVEERPWTIVGGCFLAGLALGSLIPPGRPRRTLGAPSAPMLRFQEEPPSKPGVFQKEIDKVKGLAIGYVMGLVRDSIKESVPQLASQIDELMDDMTTKMGGEPVHQHST